MLRSSHVCRREFLLRLGAIALLVLFLASCDAVLGDVMVYPSPGPSIEPSGMYQVSVVQDDARHESFVYQIHAQKTQPWRHSVCSFTTFSFSGSVVVEIKKLQGAMIRSCRVYPSSYGIIPQIVSLDTIRLTLTEPMKKMAVIFDEDWTTHPLLVFADAPETDVPSAGDAQVLYFGPGVHNAGMIKPAAGQTVYLAGGAYVKGAIDAHNQPNVTIRGRGVLSQEDMAFHQAHAIDLGWSPSYRLVEGITIVQLAFFGIAAQGSDTDIRNVKIVGAWQFTTDGVDAPSGGIVEDCFFKCNDDAIKLSFSQSIVRRNVIWQMENGAVFQISWNMPTDNRDFHIYDCDVVRTEHRWDNTNLGIIVAHHSGAGVMSKYLFEDIRVENAQNRLFNIHLFRDPQYYSIAAGNGEIGDIVIRNFRAVNCDLWRPEIIAGLTGNPARPADAGVTYFVHDITFEDLQINGDLITDAQAGNFDIDPRTTYNIAFRTSPVVPTRLEAENMVWDGSGNVVRPEGSKTIQILEKDVRAGSSIRVPRTAGELSFCVRAGAIKHAQTRVLAGPRMTLYLDGKAVGEWEVGGAAKQGQTLLPSQDYRAVASADEGIHRVELAMTQDPGGWDLLLEYVDVDASFSGASGSANARREGFETGDFSSLDWGFGDDSAWIISSGEKHSGARSACAASVRDGETATLSVSLGCQDGQISFYRKVSSEPGFDCLAFLIDGVKQEEWSGEQDWMQVSYPVATGWRIFSWTYSKDGSASQGSDMAWVDDIVFPTD